MSQERRRWRLIFPKSHYSYTEKQDSLSLSLETIVVFEISSPYTLKIATNNKMIVIRPRFSIILIELNNNHNQNNDMSFKQNEKRERERSFIFESLSFILCLCVWVYVFVVIMTKIWLGCRKILISYPQLLLLVSQVPVSVLSKTTTTTKIIRIVDSWTILCVCVCICWNLFFFSSMCVCDYPKRGASPIINKTKKQLTKK